MIWPVTWLESLPTRDTLTFCGKFTAISSVRPLPAALKPVANELFQVFEYQSNPFEAQLTRSSFLTSPTVPAKFPRASITLAPLDTTRQQLEDGEIYRLEGQVALTDRNGNQQFYYHPQRVTWKRHTQAQASPAKITMEGTGTIRQVTLPPNHSDNTTQTSSLPYLELIIEHQTNAYSGANFYAKYIIEGTSALPSDIIPLKPGVKVQLKGTLTDRCAITGLLIIKATLGYPHYSLTVLSDPS
ncbi:hypothetical protein PtB15_11B284 [Puccinia triticina]|nr:hypothetical protein PtB15_11B284 [Puccinia triticina]